MQNSQKMGGNIAVMTMQITGLSHLSAMQGVNTHQSRIIGLSMLREVPTDQLQLRFQDTLKLIKGGSAP